MQKLKSAYSTLKDRGLTSLASASYNLAKSQIEKSLLNKRFILRDVNNYKMWLDLEDKGISRSLMLFGTREVDHKVILEKVVTPKMRIFDIGANIGYYVLMERKLLDNDATIVAIEPSPSNIKLLQKNLELNDCSNVSVLEGAVSNKAGTFDFFLAEQSNLNTFHKEGSAAPHLSGVSIKVRTYTLPELAEEHGAPDLLRMDVEGHELEIIDGMLDDIAAGKYKPMICFEPHLSCYTKEHNFAPILEKLFKLGYATRYLSSNAESGTKRIRAYGYEPTQIIPSDGEQKALFEWINAEDTIKILTQSGGARTVLLAPKDKDQQSD